jgi:hypothetical protein
VARRESWIAFLASSTFQLLVRLPDLGGLLDDAPLQFFVQFAQSAFGLLALADINEKRVIILRLALGIA